MVSLKDLNETLADFSYVDGYMPTQGDVEALASISSAPSASEFPHLARWFSHIKSFTADESKAWPAASKSVKVEAKAADDDEDFELFGDEDPEEEEKRKKEAEERAKAAKSKKPAVIAKSSILIDVKPYDDTTDLKLVEQIIRSKNINDGITWGASKLVAVAFGIKKLQIMLTIIDDLVTGADLEELFEGEDLSEHVQSMDIAAWNKI